MAPNTEENLLTAGLGAEASKFIMNRRYFRITKINLLDGAVAKTVSVKFRPDNRSGLKGTFNYQATDGGVVVGSLHGNVNWDTGTVVYSVILDTSATTNTVTLSSIAVECKFTPVQSLKGRVEVSISTEMTDVTIDPKFHVGAYIQ